MDLHFIRSFSESFNKKAPSCDNGQGFKIRLRIRYLEREVINALMDVDYADFRLFSLR